GADRDRVTLTHRLVDIRDALRFMARGDHAAAVAPLQLANAAGVVPVMMGDQDIAELPAGLAQRGFDRSGLGGAARGRGPAPLIVDDHAVIVLQAQEQMGFRRHGPIRYRSEAPMSPAEAAAG